MKRFVIASLVALAGCTPPASEPETPAGPSVVAEAPGEAAALVEAAMPGFTIMTVEREDVGGQTEWEIGGTDAQGTPYEFDIMQSSAGFSVLEIQRDIPWQEAPQVVRDAVAAAPNGFEPVRVIESRQPVDGSIVYELFTVDQPAHEAVMEVRFMDGEAAVMPPAH
ncbi:hypothetical protein [Terricaulis silvestris]|uniref:Uncharacterized protein n=1 Tax=Terricaulis silvestris TaxID=2686094 RepID=A0A6I6MUD3_9CAUL|nr:hypothetical protein [Terricaulis silvestris]QGZ96988.1 hypothetical protein DSM104635_03853 [Terricaulis silvestris]